MKDDEPKKRFRVIQQDADILARPSTEQIKQLYMASSHVEWGPFAASVGWNQETADELKNQYPVGSWMDRKKEIIAKEQAEQIAELVFSHKSRWHKDVLKTLKEYPEANDAVLAILKRRINSIVKTINEGEESFQKIQTKEILALAAALKTVTEAKHKSLLISDWSISIADNFAEPMKSERILDTDWKIEVIGGENLSTKQMQEFLSRYYDKPKQLHSREELEEEMD